MALLSMAAPGGLAALHAAATAGLRDASARAEAAARQVAGAGAPPLPPAAGPQAAAPPATGSAGPVAAQAAPLVAQAGLLAAQEAPGGDPAAGLAMLLQARQAYAANAAVLRSEAAMAEELTATWR